MWQRKACGMSIAWRCGCAGTLSRWDECPQQPGNVWHIGWRTKPLNQGGPRTCMSIDIGAGPNGAGRYVYMAGFNPNPYSIQIWARKDQRCIAFFYAGDEANLPQPRSDDHYNSRDLFVRLVHIDLTRRNSRRLTGTWKRLLTVPAFTGFLTLVSELAVVADGTDVCGIESTGPHLHMDGPVTARRYTLYSGLSVTTGTGVFDF